MKEPGSFQVSTLLGVGGAEGCPHSRTMAAEVPDITSSHDYIQDGKRWCLFLYLFLTFLSLYSTPQTSHHVTLAQTGSYPCFLNKLTAKKMRLPELTEMKQYYHHLL